MVFYPDVYEVVKKICFSDRSRLYQEPVLPPGSLRIHKCGELVKNVFKYFLKSLLTTFDDGNTFLSKKSEGRNFPHCYRLKILAPKK